MTTYYITKYALSNGGQLIEATDSGERSASDESYIWLKAKNTKLQDLFVIGRDAFTDKAEAAAAVLKARDKKVASLRKQIDKLMQIGGAA